VTLAWVFFRLPHFAGINLFVNRLGVWHVDAPLGMHRNEIMLSLFLIVGLLVWDRQSSKKMRPKTWLLPLMLLAIYFLGVFSLKQFIYFQF
jgi:predicted membrane metal-binding protein